MIHKVFPILALSTFCSMLGLGVMSPLLPGYAQNMGATGTWIGLVFGGFSITRAIFAPVAGYLSDRRGRKLFISLGLVTGAAVSFAYLWADTPWELVIVRLLHGGTAGIVLPVAQAYVGDVAPKGREGTWMGYYTASFFSAFAVGPILGGSLADHFGVPAAFIVMGSLNALAFVAATAFLPEIHGRQTVDRAAPSFGPIIRSRMVAGLFTYRLATEVGWAVFFCFLPIVAAANLQLNSTLIGTVLAANMLFTSLLMVPMGRIADRFNRKTLIILGTILAAIQLALTCLASQFWHLLLLSAIGGFGGAITGPTVAALSVEEGRRYGMGTILTLMSTAMSIGVALGPIGGGAVADAAGMAATFYVASAMSLAGLAVFLWLGRGPAVTVPAAETGAPSAASGAKRNSR